MIFIFNPFISFSCSSSRPHSRPTYGAQLASLLLESLPLLSIIFIVNVLTTFSAVDRRVVILFLFVHSSQSSPPCFSNEPVALFPRLAASHATRILVSTNSSTTIHPNTLHFSVIVIFLFPLPIVYRTFKYHQRQRQCIPTDSQQSSSPTPPSSPSPPSTPSFQFESSVGLTTASLFSFRIRFVQLAIVPTIHAQPIQQLPFSVFQPNITNGQPFFGALFVVHFIFRLLFQTSKSGVQKIFLKQNLPLFRQRHVSFTQ